MSNRNRDEMAIAAFENIYDKGTDRAIATYGFNKGWDKAMEQSKAELERLREENYFMRGHLEEMTQPGFWLDAVDSGNSSDFVFKYVTAVLAKYPEQVKVCEAEEEEG